MKLPQCSALPTVPVNFPSSLCGEQAYSHFTNEGAMSERTPVIFCTHKATEPRGRGREGQTKVHRALASLVHRGWAYDSHLHSLGSKFWLLVNMGGVQEGQQRLHFPEKQKGKAEGRIRGAVFWSDFIRAQWRMNPETHAVTMQESSELWKAPITVRLEHIQAGHCTSLGFL